MTLFGKRFFADVVQFLMRKAPWTTWVGPKSNDKCPYKRHTEEKTDRGGEGSVKMEAETEQCSHRRMARTGISPRASGRISVLPTPYVWTPFLQGWERISILF